MGFFGEIYQGFRIVRRLHVLEVANDFSEQRQRREKTNLELKTQISMD